MRRSSEIACFCLGACLASAILWEVYRKRRPRPASQIRPHVDEPEVERFVARELARIGYKVSPNPARP